MPDATIEERLRAVLARRQSAVDELRPLLVELAMLKVRRVLPSLRRLEVLGQMNADGAYTLRIQRALDDDGNVLFRAGSGAADDVEMAIDDVNVDVLDVLLDVSGTEYLGRHVLGERPDTSQD